jgi:hypothetical protein
MWRRVELKPNAPQGGCIGCDPIGHVFAFDSESNAKTSRVHAAAGMIAFCLESQMEIRDYLDVRFERRSPIGPRAARGEI